ncbi:MAG TPA: galactokinase family protein [Gemmatimonadaceae bacterium]|nr:galactokinase family protein [Gemmatimonadaceae bacterium]
MRDAAGHALDERLALAGMSHEEVGRKTRLFTLASTALARRHALRLWVPGRIEFLGKHTDYAGGRSLVCTVERGFAVAASPRDDRTVRLTDAVSGDRVETELSQTLPPADGTWANYAITVVRRIARNFPGPLRGADIAFASDLPPAAGLSSSSALVVATFLTLSDLNALAAHEEYRAAIANADDLAGYLGAVEGGAPYRTLAGDRGVGTFSGSQDHTAILCSRAGALVQYAFAPVRFERMVPLPSDHVFVIGTSGVLAEKTGAALELYNRQARRVFALLDRWRAATGRNDATLGAVLASSGDALARLRAIVRDPAVRSAGGDGFEVSDLVTRLDQFAAEADEIIPAAGDALERGDLEALGALVDRSQRGAELLLGNQVPETFHLARSARSLGAAAASAFGAGFGGSVWALVRRDDAERFERCWRESYEMHFPQHADRAAFFITTAGPAAMRL